MSTARCRALSRSEPQQNSRTMKKYVEFSDEALECLLTGKAVVGTLKMDLMTRQVSFNMFNRKPRHRAKDLILHETTSGWLKKSVKKFKIFVSANNRMERERAATEILRQAKELADHLKNTKSIEEIMNEI